MTEARREIKKEGNTEAINLRDQVLKELFAMLSDLECGDLEKWKKFAAKLIGNKEKFLLPINCKCTGNNPNYINQKRDEGLNVGRMDNNETEVRMEALSD